MRANRLRLYIHLTRLNRPIGALLLLWPTLWALWIASNGHPNPLITTIFMLGTLLMRSAGCVMNDYADRKIDPYVERTRNRPLATGEISHSEALVLTVMLCLLSFLIILPLNGLTILLSIPALLLAASYPYTKRFFTLPQAYLGVAFGFGIPMAFAAQTGHLSNVAWILLIANIFWSVAYDTEYAMVDRNDDIHLGIRSSALLFGKHDIAIIMLCHITLIGILYAIGVYLHRHLFFNAGLLVALGLISYQYGLIRKRDRADCFKAFLHNNWVGAAIFAGIFLDYAFPIRG
ncbi:MAG: 4-hydroxybenzoate octaprenyltransferase [Proteobacteria bacterium]|nr:4-hydroxybenzoate octaprenyltransferase [Pseudomonadota bacterium]MDE3208099.1 4-hydroxybenzoate octaprenyltransferase [Pseudomonadota bacterium]